MQVNGRLIDISHNDTSNRQGGNMHLTAEEHTKIQRLGASQERFYDVVKDKLPKLYAWGSNTQNWRGAEWVSAATPRELEISVENALVKSKPTKLTIANPITFLAKFANRNTYGYGIINKYFILDTPNRIAYADMPVKCEGLGDWIDVKMPRYWANTQPDGSVKPSILLDTSKHLELPICADGITKTLEYNERGDGFTATINGVTSPLTWANPEGAKIKRIVLSCSVSNGAIVKITCVIYAEDGVYYQNGDSSLALIKLDFTYGDIKNVWLISVDSCFIQNMNGDIYSCSIAGGNYVNLSNTPIFTGKVKKLPFNSTMSFSYLLNEDGKLYYYGQANATHDLPQASVFTHIKTDYRFDDIVTYQTNCLAIGRKIA